MTKSYYCPKLETTLNFLPKEIKYCCSCALGPGIKIKDSKTIEKNRLSDYKTLLVSQLKRGIIPANCVGCREYKEYPEEKQNLLTKSFNLLHLNKTPKVSHLIINHYKQCECKCIYCFTINQPKIDKQNYNALPLVKQMYKNKMIDKKNLMVEFQGGNVSLLSEFEDLLNEFSKNGCTNFVILTNGVKYLPAIENHVKESKFRICISLDSGTKETFNKIKRIDVFEEVLENIKKFSSFENVELILKYITIQDINDNINEINEFLNIAQNVGNVSSVAFDIDYRNTFLSKEGNYEAPKHYKKMFEEVEKICEEKNIAYSLQPQLKEVLEKGYYE